MDQTADSIPFVFRIFRVSPLNSKILASSPPILLIPKDRGVGEGGGVPFKFYGADSEPGSKKKLQHRGAPGTDTRHPHPGPIPKVRHDGL